MLIHHALSPRKLHAVKRAPCTNDRLTKTLKFHFLAKAIQHRLQIYLPTFFLSIVFPLQGGVTILRNLKFRPSRNFLLEHTIYELKYSFRHESLVLSSSSILLQLFLSIMTHFFPNRSRQTSR